MDGKHVSLVTAQSSLKWSRTKCLVHLGEYQRSVERGVIIRVFLVFSETKICHSDSEFHGKCDVTIFFSVGARIEYYV